MGRKKPQKTMAVYVIQGHYGQGWEDETEETSSILARERLREYRKNMPEYSHRLITRRVPFEKQTKQAREKEASEVWQVMEKNRTRKELRRKK